MKLVLDASAVAKWFIVEEESGEMRELRKLQVLGIVDAYAPHFLLVEIANLLKYSEGLVLEDVLNAIEALKVIGIKMVSDSEILKEAVKEAFENNITVYDALYVALAKKLNAKLVTYDSELLSKYGKIAFKASHILSTLKKTSRNPL